jgi:SAM-dependent methyltransferase
MTGVRGLDVPVVDGCRMLTSATIEYRDGAEQRVFELVSGAVDLSSTSDELAAQATTWAERYHLATGRANLLRPFTLPREATVLEIGAGCGAITRLLGERCAAVDALEPVLARARVARSRTRDLAHVEVFVGSLEDIPAEAAYDLVVVVGVLEYVGEGAVDLAPQAEFLRRIGAVLKPAGALFLAIENRLGVKYLAGSGEDHTRVVYDGVEGYPRGAPVRTFSRSELTGLLCGAGLTPTFYSAFPDYKLTRTVLSDELYEVEPSLAWRIPQFPSPDRSGVLARGVNEERLWRALVDDGIGANFANSFVVTASGDRGGPVARRPPGRLLPTRASGALLDRDHRGP